MYVDPALHQFLLRWHHPLLLERDLIALFPQHPQRRHEVLRLAQKHGVLLRLRRGIYLIQRPYQQDLPSRLEISHRLYGPSHVSLESALSFHQWIPEAVYATTCATTKRSLSFNTPLGFFDYGRVPTKEFFLGVQRLEPGAHRALLIASPWRALADYIYARKRHWNGVSELSEDLRIEEEELVASDRELLKELSLYYPSMRVRNLLQKFLRELFGS